VKARVGTPQRHSSRIHQLTAKKLTRLADMLNPASCFPFSLSCSASHPSAPPLTSPSLHPHLHKHVFF
jgi:hypothetical protein